MASIREHAAPPDPKSATPTTSPRHNAAPLWTRHRSALVLTLSLVIQLGLLVYAAHVDANPVGGLKYTDVDWRVVYDGIVHTAHPRDGARAQGWLACKLQPYIAIGSPYERATFRYTPLLVLVLSPALVSPILGRLVLVGLTLALPPVLLSSGSDFWTTTALWTLNPIVLNITTRGSPEALACLLTAALVVALRNAGLGLAFPKADSRRWQDAAAVLLALSASYKIYPVIYVAPIWTALAGKYGWLGLPVWRFGIVAASTALVVNFALWSIWGQEFLQHTYLYHLSRLDHRHNFSPYFLPIYLSLTTTSPSPSSWLLTILRHPLASFLPQFSLVLGAGVALTPRIGLEAAMFFQTALFVVFNKVCTSQYFLWPLPLVPLLRLPGLTWRTLAISLAAWIGAQALWLSIAYRLEFLAEAVYLPLWAAGLVLFSVSVAGIGILLDAA